VVEQQEYTQDAYQKAAHKDPSGAKSGVQNCH
jgi:hypothetical protein